MLQQLSQLAFTVWHELLIGLFVCEGGDDPTQDQQTFVYVNALLRVDSLGAHKRLLLRTCQVNQLETTDRHVHELFYVLRFHCKREDAVATARELVEVVRG